MNLVFASFDWADPHQSMLNAAGPPAGGIERLWWIFFWLLLAIFVAVMTMVAMAAARRHRGLEQEPLEARHVPSPQTERRLTTVVTWSSVTTVVILLALIVVSIAFGRSTGGAGVKPALTVEVVGNQWWWYVRCLDDNAQRIVVTANEFHIPVGKPIQIRGSSQDVIHSFWLPNLQGKRDLFPSRITTEWIQADRPGRFRGQCAEFCGLQHAHMAFWVVAEPENEFNRWMDAQRSPAANPASDDERRGQQVFLGAACVMCHNISGTPAAGQVGPDLTHFGSRSTIAAGTLPNNTGNLGAWITDPQSVKPGNHMAVVPVKSEDLQPLIAYLESLK